MPATPIADFRSDTVTQPTPGMVKAMTEAPLGDAVFGDDPTVLALEEETAALLAIAKRGMSMGGGAGGPTIMDMASGALSYEDKFIDVWLAFNLTGRPPFSRSDLAPFKAVTASRKPGRSSGHWFGPARGRPASTSGSSGASSCIIRNDSLWLGWAGACTLEVTMRDVASAM